jgi:hypothetical protein
MIDKRAEITEIKGASARGFFIGKTGGAGWQTGAHPLKQGRMPSHKELETQ